MQMYTRFGDRLSQGQNLASNREAKRERENIIVRVWDNSFCCGPTQLKHECVLNQHDSGEKAEQELHAGDTKAALSRGESRM